MFKLLYNYRRARMSELGNELLEAAREDEWVVNTYTWTHCNSGIALWISNGFSHFRLRHAGRLDEDELRGALNKHDRKILWEWFLRHRKQAEENAQLRPVEQTLNLLRLKRQHPPENQP